MLKSANINRIVSSKASILPPGTLGRRLSLFLKLGQAHPPTLLTNHHDRKTPRGTRLCLDTRAQSLQGLCGFCLKKITEGQKRFHSQRCLRRETSILSSCLTTRLAHSRPLQSPSCLATEATASAYTDASSIVETRSGGTGAGEHEKGGQKLHGQDQLTTVDIVSRAQVRAETSSPSSSQLEVSEIWSWAEKRGIRLTDCCEPERKLRVAVLLSGGVDSSVALNLLLAAGHECTCFYLKIWFQEDFRNFWSQCPWEDDLRVAEEVCKSAGVELKVVHLTEEYWDRVVSHTVDEIRSGRTPNPDILCNSRVKYGAFLEKADLAPFDRIASGHYARLVRSHDDSGPVTLQLSADGWKDQTYFLSQMTQRQLAKAMFPLGGMTKPEVRELATSLRLPNSDRKDSQGICFLGKVKFTEFVAEHLGESPGRILDAESGEYLGMHSGFWFYTIGQRQGLGLSGGPWYVVAKDTARNVIFASRTYSARDRPSVSFLVGPFNWIRGSPPSPLSQLRCKVRHGPKLYDCRLEFLSQDCARVHLGEGDQGLAAGQYAAFYDSDVCLGSAVIVDASGAVESSVPSQIAKEAAAREGGAAKGRLRFDGLKRNVFGERAKTESNSSVGGLV